MKALNEISTPTIHDQVLIDFIKKQKKRIKKLKDRCK